MDKDDLSADFQNVTSGRSTATDAAEMEQFMQTYEQGAAVAPAPETADPARPLPPPKPVRRKTDDPIGRLPPPEDKQSSAVSRNLAEIPGAAVAGVESAIKNALGFAIDPLANWLNENVADLSYTRADPKTPTGAVTKSVTEFLTGFIPAIKVLRGAGATGNIAAPMAAGAFADFAVRDPSGGRLADLWKKFELPPNILTDYLSSKPEDTEMEARFKNALEGLGLGVLAEGVFLGARALRAAKNVKGAGDAEKVYLKSKYGELDEQTFNQIIGDPSKPGVEMVVHKPGPQAGKIAQGAADTAKLDPRAVIRNKPKKSAVPAQAADVDPVAGTKIVDENGKPMKVYHGSPEKGFVEFDKAKINPNDPDGPYNGFYFSTSAKEAKWAGDYPWGRPNTPGGGEVREVYLNIKNPATRTEAYKVAKDIESDWHKLYPEARTLNDATRMELQKRGYDGVVHEAFVLPSKKEFDKAGYVDLGKKNYRLEKDPEFDGAVDLWRVSKNGEKEYITGYASFEQAVDQLKHGTYVAFEPSQIIPVKSAIRTPAQAADAVAAGGKLTSEEIKAYPKLAELSGVKSTIKSEDFEVYVNFARFDEPDEIKFAIGKMAENAKGTIDEATRGVITQKETEKLAGELGMTVTDLLARRKGQGFNAEEAVAARQLWAASAEKLVELAKTAASKNAGALDQFAFRRQMAVHSAIQAEVIGARTETARALASWKIGVKGNVERARAIDQVMLAMGGPEQSAEMARRLAILAEVGANPAAIARFAEKGAGAASVDAVREAWVNGLLSSPATHVVNTMSNTLVAFNSIIERGVAAGIRGFTGGEGVKAQEAAAMAFGMVEGVRDAFKLAVKALRTGETSWTFNKMDLPRTHAISSEAFGMSRETGLGRFVDYVGTAVRVPTRLLGAEDEFFKAIGYRMELHAQAARTASQEGLRGFDFGKRVAEIVTNPPESVMINSADAALYNTFTGEMGSFGKAIMNLRNIDHPLNPATFVLPFVRTPVNLARFAFERSPFAPLVSQWRADIAAGGARADLALAKMSTGTAVMLMAMDIADKGLITGPGHYGGKDTATTEAAQRQGLMPYSVKVGDRWYSYNRTDPFGMTIGFAASIAEAVKRGEISEEEVDEWQEVTAMSIAAVSQVVISKTYLEGFAKFVEMMSDPKRHSQRYVDELFASFLPMTAGMSAAKNLVDPVSREVSSPAEAVMARIAGLSENLPPRRNLWGEEITNESGLGKGYDFLSPIKSKPLNAQPIDREMVRLGKGVERIDKQTSFDGVRANMRFYPKAYDDYVRLAGNDLKHPAWGMGAKDYLNAVVSGKHPMSTVYNMLSDDSRVAFIQAAIGDYRKLAQRQILADPKHAGFASEVRQLKQFSQRNKMPVLGE